MEANLRFIEKLKFIATTGSGHVIVTEGKREGMETKTTAPASMEALLVALGSCVGMDVVWILNKMRKPAEQLSLSVNGNSAEDHPKVFTDIQIKVEGNGKDLDLRSLEKAVDLSLEKYCPVGAMLKRGGVKITASCNIL